VSVILLPACHQQPLVARNKFWRCSMRPWSRPAADRWSWLLRDRNAMEGCSRRFALARHLMSSSIRSPARCIDVIHMHGVDFYRYLPQVSIPTIVTLHLPPSWYPPQVLSSDRLNTYLVCVSQSQRRSCPQDARIHTVIENGVPLEKFESFGKKEDYVAALGRICPEKGFHLALDAATTAGLSLRLAGEVFGYAAHRHYWKTEIEPRLKSPHRFLGALALRQKRELLARARCLLVT